MPAPRPWPVAQYLDTHLGKIMRITKDGAPAPGNPFIGQQGALPEIWAIGLRSQEGLAFAPDGELYEVEHGPRGGDELNLIKKGGNYGWPIISHGIDYPGEPIGDGEVAKAGHGAAGLLLVALHRAGRAGLLQGQVQGLGGQRLCRHAERPPCWTASSW